jgi:glycine cleavage system aminomethyltransferase T
MPVREGTIFFFFAGTSQVGVITSGGLLSVGAPIAMGYVAAGHNEAGTALEDGTRQARAAQGRKSTLRLTSLSPQRPTQPVISLKIMSGLKLTATARRLGLNYA